MTIVNSRRANRSATATATTCATTCAATPARVVLLAALSALGIGLAGPVQAQGYPLYTVTGLPQLSAVTAFNDRGQILGRGFLPCTGLCSQSDSAVLYDTATATLQGLTGGFGQGPVYGALNAAGQLAGTTQSVDGTGATVRTVVLRQPDGTLTTLAAPTLTPALGSRLQVRGLSATGRMALQYSNGLDGFGPVCGDYLGWLGNGASAAGWQALGAAGTVLSLAGINAGGVAVGSAAPAASCGGVGQGFRAVASGANGALLNLHGALPGVFSHATGINDLGYAVGEVDSGARTAPDAFNPLGVPIARAVVWNTASLQPTDLGVAGTSSRLNAVNNRGEVVGRATGPMAAGQPLAGASTWAVLGNLATGAPLVNLNTLLSQNTGGWVLQEALAINRSGQIVARGRGAAGSGFVLLTPVSAPADPYAAVPVAPASLAVSAVTATSARLGWTLAARNATRVVVERCTGSRCTNFAAVATLAGDATGYSNTGLARRTAYRWRVRAGNAVGLSAASNLATATTLR